MTGLEQIEAPPGPDRTWCLFRGPDRPYALGLESVAEVIEVDHLVRLPLSPPGVVGICHFRREVVPVFGPSSGDWDASPWNGGRQLVLILRTTQGLWGLRITPGGTVIGQGAFDDDAPQGVGGPASPVCLGTVRHGETTYAVIDPEATWLGARRNIEAWYANEWCRGASGKGESPGPTFGGRS